MYVCMYVRIFLADKYGGLSTPEQRGTVSSWVVWANASLDPVLFKENEKGIVFSYFIPNFILFILVFTSSSHSFSYTLDPILCRILHY